MTINNQSISLSARQILLKRLSTAQALAYTGPLGELIIDTTLKQVRVQDGVTPGGILMMTASNIANLQSQIDSLRSNLDPAAIDSFTEIVANVNALLSNNTESSLTNSGFYANLTNTGNLVVDGTILPKTHLTQDLGSSTRAWRSLYLSNATAYFGNAALTITDNGLTVIANGNTLPIIGNIRFPDGSVQQSAVDQKTVANIFSLLTANVAANLVAINNDVTNAISYFGNLVTNAVLPIESNVTVLQNSKDRLTSGNANLVLIGGNDPFVTFPAVSTGENIFIQGGEIASLSGTAAVTSSNSVVINTGALSVLKTWTFGENGTLTVPGNIVFANDYVYSGNTFKSPETNGILKDFKWQFSDLASGADTVTLRWNLLGTTFPQWYLSTNNESSIYSFDGDAKALGFVAAGVSSGTVTFGTAANNGAGSGNDIELTTVTGDAYIRAGSDSWKFDNNGNLTLPAGGDILDSTGNSVLSGGNPFNQDLDTTDSPNFVNLGLAGTSGAGYATLSIANNRDFVIGLNDTTTGAQTFEFTRNGVVLVPGTIESQNMLEIIGDTVRLWGEGQFSNASLNLPNNNDSNSMPTALVNLGNAGVSIGTGITPYEWNFGSDGNLTLPTGVIGPSTTDKGLVISGPLTADMVPVNPQNPSSYNTISNGVNIRTHRVGDNLTRDWTFSWDGTLYPPHDTGASQVGAIEWRVPDLNIANQIRPTRGSGTEPAGLKLFTYGPNVAITLEAGLGVDAKWHFKDDGKLKVPGDIVGYQTYINSNPLDERVTIQPSGSVDKPFKFITDQNAGTWQRSMMELPVAEVNKAVTLGFPHSDNKVGYIYTQGTDSSGTEFNNAFNIMANSTDVKIGVVSGGGNKIWKFDANGAITFPDSTVQSTAYPDFRSSYAVALGYESPENAYSVNLGMTAGNSNSNYSIAIGFEAGKFGADVYATKIGFMAGKYGLNDGIAIGYKAGYGIIAGNSTDATVSGSSLNTGTGTGFAIGQYLSTDLIGSISFMEGTKIVAGSSPNWLLNFPATSNGSGAVQSFAPSAGGVILNGSVGQLPGNASTPGFYVNPVQAGTTGHVLYYNDTTKEITYGAVASGTVDVTDTNGLTTIYYPTFVENRSSGQTVRADQHLSYRTDSNLLTVGNIKTVGNITTNVLKIEDGVHEALTIRAGDGGGFTSDFDCSTGYISYCTSVSGNWTANFTNLTLAEGYATVLTIVIEQTGTPGYPSAVQIEGSSKTILWQGNTLPTPSTTGTDVVTFSILRTGISGNEYVVLGQMTGF